MQFDFNVAANQSQVLDVAGRFFKYKSGTGLIRVRATNGGYVDLLPGQGVWNTEFTSLTISDRTGLQNAGVILAGDFDFHDDRISGTVSVVDDAKSRTLANAAYLADIGIAGSAGNYMYAELWNPAGSGKNLIVESVYCSSTTAGFAVLRSQTTQLGTLAEGPVTKKIGAASASVALCNTLLAPGPYVGTQIHGVNLAASQGFKFEFVEPIIIMPGSGLSANGDLGQGLSSVFEYFEDPV